MTSTINSAIERNDFQQVKTAVGTFIEEVSNIS